MLPGTVLTMPSRLRARRKDPRRFDLIVVKLPHTPHHEYEAWAAKILNVDTPGAASPNVKTLNHRQVTRPIYPLDEDTEFTLQVELVARGQTVDAGI
jgi:microcystin degradation protein MlrC